MVALLSPPDVAALLKLKSRTPYDPRWRLRVGIRAIRVGRSLRFRAEDIQELIERGLEYSPDEARR